MLPKTELKKESIKAFLEKAAAVQEPQSFFIKLDLIFLLP